MDDSPEADDRLVDQTIQPFCGKQFYYCVHKGLSMVRIDPAHPILSQ
jgi:hypothetical protein